MKSYPSKSPKTNPRPAKLKSVNKVLTYKNTNKPSSSSNKGGFKVENLKPPKSVKVLSNKQILNQSRKTTSSINSKQYFNKSKSTAPTQRDNTTNSTKPSNSKNKNNFNSAKVNSTSNQKNSKMTLQMPFKAKTSQTKTKSQSKSKEKSRSNNDNKKFYQKISVTEENETKISKNKKSIESNNKNKNNKEKIDEKTWGKMVANKKSQKLSHNELMKILSEKKKKEIKDTNFGKNNKEEDNIIKLDINNDFFNQKEESKGNNNNYFDTEINSDIINNDINNNSNNYICNYNNTNNNTNKEDINNYITYTNPNLNISSSNNIKIISTNTAIDNQPLANKFCNTYNNANNYLRSKSLEKFSSFRPLASSILKESNQLGYSQNKSKRNNSFSDRIRDIKEKNNEYIFYNQAKKYFNSIINYNNKMDIYKDYNFRNKMELLHEDLKNKYLNNKSFCLRNNFNTEKNEEKFNSLRNKYLKSSQYISNSQNNYYNNYINNKTNQFFEGFLEDEDLNESIRKSKTKFSIFNERNFNNIDIIKNKNDSKKGLSKTLINSDKFEYDYDNLNDYKKKSIFNEYQSNKERLNTDNNNNILNYSSNFNSINNNISHNNNRIRKESLKNNLSIKNNDNKENNNTYNKTIFFDNESNNNNKMSFGLLLNKINGKLADLYEITEKNGRSQLYLNSKKKISSINCLNNKMNLVKKSQYDNFINKTLNFSKTSKNFNDIYSDLRDEIVNMRDNNYKKNKGKSKQSAFEDALENIQNTLLYVNGIKRKKLIVKNHTYRDYFS